MGGLAIMLGVIVRIGIPVLVLLLIGSYFQHRNTERRI